MAIPRNLANLANQLNTDGDVPKIEVNDSKVEVTDTGSNGTIVFNTDNAERMRVTNTGNLGIGTTSPTNIISLGGNSARTIWMERHTTSNTAGNNLTIRAGGATSGATDKNGGTLVLSSGTATGSGSSVITFATAAAGGSGTTDRDTAERMRINANGTVLINSTDTTPSGVANIKLNVVGQQMFAGTTGATTQSDTAKGVINFRANTGSGSNTEAWANYYPGIFMDVITESGNDGFANSALMIRAQRGAATNPGPYLRFGAGNQGSANFSQQFRVAIDSGAVANVNGVYGSLSDLRLKRDITDASSQWDDIKAIRVRKFKMKSDFELAETINAANPDANWTPPYYIGAIAQELEEISPGLIEHEGGDNNFKTIKYSILYMKAIKALQEAMERIETLEAKVAAMERA